MYNISISVILLTIEIGGMVLPAIFYSLYSIWCGNHDTSTWYTMYDMSVPIDTTTFIGWYFQLFIIQTPFGLMYCIVCSGIFAHFLSCCLYIQAGREHIQMLIDNLKEKHDAIWIKREFIKIKNLHDKVLQ